jgi:hypothetical protein
MKVLFIYFNIEYRPRTLLSMSILLSSARQDGHEIEIFNTSFYEAYLNSTAEKLYKSGIFGQF